MDLSDFANTVGPRPKSARCMRCKKKFAVKPIGRVPIYCSQNCKQAMFKHVRRLTRPKEPKPKRPRLPLSEQSALRVWQALIDAKIIPADTPMPPPREPEREQ